MLYKQPVSDNWYLDLSFRGIGRLRLSTETPVRKRAQLMESMLVSLHQSGKAKFVEELRAKSYSLPFLFTRYQSGELDTLATAATLQPLENILDWIDEHPELRESTKVGYRKLAKRLIAQFPNATLHQIPQVLRDHRVKCLTHLGQDGKSKPITRSWNQARSMCQAFVRDRIGKRTPLWNDVANLSLIGYVVDTGKKLSYKELRDVIYHLWPDQRMMVWSLVLTGMRQGEYTGSWQLMNDRIRVLDSAKARQSGMTFRDVPFIEHQYYHGPLVEYEGYSKPIDPKRKLQTLQRDLRKHAKHGWNLPVSCHDFRHTYRHWLMLAGVPDVRAERYLGHKFNPKNVQEVYTSHDVGAFLRDDALLMEKWLKAQEEEWQQFHYEHSIDFIEGDGEIPGVIFGKEPTPPRKKGKARQVGVTIKPRPEPSRTKRTKRGPA